MKFTFEVESISLADRNLRVVYTPADTTIAPYHGTIPASLDVLSLPVEEAKDALRKLIILHAPVASWQTQIELKQVKVPSGLLEVIGAGFEVSDEEHQASLAAKPEPVEVKRTEIEAAEEEVARIARSRYEAESKGLVWTDAKGGNWFLDTSVASQNRFASARLAVQSSTRVDGGVWKCASLDAFGAATLVYRPTSNEEIIVWSDLVHAHVQKCFEAEAKSVEKAVQGSKDSDVFMREFDAL